MLFRSDDENIVVAITENMRGEVRATPYVNTLSSGGGKPGQGYPAIAFHATQIPVFGSVAPTLGASSQIGDADLGVAHTLTTMHGATEDGTGRGTPRVACPGPEWIVRRLTPRECERLQGFPDDWTKWRADGSEIPDGPRYRMLGNAVSVTMAYWLGRRVYAALEAAR